MSEFTPVGDELNGEPIPDYFADVGRRLEWANGDGQAFNDLSKSLRDTGAYGIWVEFEGDRWKATFRRLCDPAVEEEALTELAHVLGSFLEHSRAALNYAVYQLALLAIRENPALNDPALPGKDRLRPDTVEYPITRRQEDFSSHNGIRNLPEKYRGVIKAHQPYDGKNQGLRMLNELAREYRHRVVHAAAITPIEDMHHVLINDVPVPTLDMEIIPRERLEDGDVVLRFSLPDTYAGANVKPNVVIAVGIAHALTRGLDGTRVLNEIAGDVNAALDEIEREFFPS